MIKTEYAGIPTEELIEFALEERVYSSGGNNLVIELAQRLSTAQDMLAEYSNLSNGYDARSTG